MRSSLSFFFLQDWPIGLLVLFFFQIWGEGGATLLCVSTTNHIYVNTLFLRSATQCPNPINLKFLLKRPHSTAPTIICIQKTLLICPSNRQSCDHSPPKGGLLCNNPSPPPPITDLPGSLVAAVTDPPDHLLLP